MKETHAGQKNHPKRATEKQMRRKDKEAEERMAAESQQAQVISGRTRREERITAHRTQ